MWLTMPASAVGQAAAAAARPAARPPRASGSCRSPPTRWARSDGDPVEVEILEAGIHRGIGMAGEEAPRRAVRRSVRAARPSSVTRGPVSGWSRPAGAVEQQRHRGVGGDGLGMLGQVAQQQDRRQVVIDRHQHQRGIGPGSACRSPGPAGRWPGRRDRGRAAGRGRARDISSQIISGQNSLNSRDIDGRSWQRRQRARSVLPFNRYPPSLSGEATPCARTSPSSTTTATS